MKNTSSGELKSILVSMALLASKSAHSPHTSAHASTSAAPTLRMTLSPALATPQSRGTSYLRSCLLLEPTWTSESKLFCRPHLLPSVCSCCRFLPDPRADTTHQSHIPLHPIPISHLAASCIALYSAHLPPPEGAVLSSLS